MVSLGWGEDKESAHWKAFQSTTDRSPAEILTDYSYAGYEHGEKAIPDVPGPVFKVTDYGAIADDTISDEDAIRKRSRRLKRRVEGWFYFRRVNF